MKRRILSMLLVICMLAAMLPMPTRAATSLPSSIYLTQEGTSTCTLCSATMMLRARMYLSNNDDWSSITESATRSTAWLEGSGLRWGFTYSINGNSMTVAHQSTSGISISTLKSLLNNHPEGIVLYCGNLPHAVFLTDYDGDTFYCADTISGYSGKRIPLASSYLGKKYGSQANVLANVTAYWYTSSYSIESSGNNPIGAVDSVTGGLQCVSIAGWVYDVDSLNEAIAIDVYIGGPAGTGEAHGRIYANGYRPDVGAGNYHGFNATYYTKLTGSQPIYIYAINVGSGDNQLLSSEAVTITADTETPQISNIKVTNINDTGYTVSCTVTDNTGVSSVRFPTWTWPEQDDLAENWETTNAVLGTKNGDTYTFRVNFSEHNNEKTRYATHIYAWDNYGNKSVAKLEDYGYSEMSARYSVSFNANGGSGAPSSQIVLHGQTLTLSSTKPTRTGYTFLGWSTSSTATSATYSAGGSFTTNANTTLYAVWKINTYKITYNANGGSGAPSSQTKTHGTTLALSGTNPTRTGYTFLGWSTSSSATSATYSAGGGFTTNADTTLYAVWKADTYTVSYNANGGTGAPSDQTKTYGETLTLSSTEPTRTNYTFKGWATSSAASRADYAAGDSFTTNANTTLYAVWEHVCAVAHSYSATVTKEPTVESTGTLDAVCSKCGATKTETLPVLNASDYLWSDVTEPTCTDTGLSRYIWNTTTYGMFVFDVVLPEIGHNYSGIEVLPSCTEQGYIPYYCTNCGDSYNEVTAAARGHSWSEWSVIIEATETTAGEKIRTCGNCGETENEIIPASGSPVTPPTESEPTTPPAENDPTTPPVDDAPVNPPAVKENPFVDVPGDAFYHDPVLWAVDNAITNGLDDTHFGPEVGCTRAHVVTFLWRAAGCPAPSSGYNPFTDVLPGSYYYDAVLWAVEKGITNGTSATTFEPDVTCTRGQIVTFLWRYQHSPSASAANSFTDVPAGQYYSTAVAWAVENGITNGMGNGIFAPDATCTRGQIVTFLHRAVN